MESRNIDLPNHLATGLDESDDYDSEVPDEYLNRVEDINQPTASESIIVSFADGKSISIGSRKESISQLKAHLFDITNKIFNHKGDPGKPGYFG